MSKVDTVRLSVQFEEDVMGEFGGVTPVRERRFFPIGVDGIDTD